MNKHKLELFLRNCVQKQRINCAHVYVKTYNVLTPGQKCLKNVGSKLFLASPGRQIIPFYFALPLLAFTTASSVAYFQKYCDSYFGKKICLFAECTLSKIPRHQKQKSSRKQFVKCGKIHVNWLLWRFV